MNHEPEGISLILPLTPVRLKRHAAEVFGSKQGVVCANLRFTYREFNERADRLSDALLRLGIKLGDRVAYLSFNCHRLLEGYYGVPQIGAILLPLNIRLSAEELTFILNDSGARLLFFDPEFVPLLEAMRPQLKTVERFVALHGEKPAWAHAKTHDEMLAEAEAREIDFRGIDENSVAELFYTSGTTAHPKGVMLTHRNLYLHAFYVATALRCDDTTVHLYTVPLFHVNSWGAPHTFSLVGGRHVMIRKFDPLTVLQLVHQERVTQLHMVPTMVIAVLNHPDFHKYDVGSVKEVMMGGAPTNTALVRQIEEKLPGCVAMGGYGLTETSPVLTLAHMKEHLAGTPEEVKLRRKATAGYAIAGTEIRVVDLQGRDVQRNGKEEGEVIVRSDIVMAGYWNRPDDPAIRDGWFHTGDIATIDEEGYILIVDRAKDMILSGGENIASAEIERVIYGHASVLECAVIAVPDDTWGEVGKALVSLKSGQEASERQILDHCRQHLAGFKVPKTVEFMESLPKGGTGKILKKVLREKYWTGRDRRVH